MFFKYNEQLGPPYHVLVDTNFINFTIKNRLDIHQGMQDCLMAKVTPYVTDCVVGELFSKFRDLKYVFFDFSRIGKVRTKVQSGAENSATVGAAAMSAQGHVC